MDHSAQQQLLTLGKLIVAQLNLDQDKDMLSQWMAHYLAEKISVVTSVTTAHEKEAVSKECFALILQLWEHRWHYPNGKQPLRKFDHILHVLEQLDEDRPFYASYFDHNWENSQQGQAGNWDEGQILADQIKQVDKGAKACISFLTREAARLANTEDASQILGAAKNIMESMDVEVLLQLVDSLQADDESEQRQAYKKIEAERLKKDITLLEALSYVNEHVLQRMRQKLSLLEK